MAKNIIRHISHLKSSGATKPAAADLIYGEIAVGYGKDNETLFIRNSNDDVVEFKNAAASIKEAKDYTNDRVISTVVDDDVVIATLNAVVESSDSGRTLTVSHKNDFTAQSGFNKLATDTHGHVTGATAVTLSDLTTTGALSGVTGENGISASTRTSGNQKIGHTNIITAGTAKTNTTAATVTPTGANVEIPSIVYDANGHITSTSTTNVLLKVNTATTSTAGVVKIATTTGNNNTDTVMTQSAVTKAIEDSFAQQDAMVYKGLVGGTGDFPETFSKGATYKVATAFTANNEKYEIGDMFIANTDVTASESFNSAHWDAIQTNLDPTLYANTATTITAASGLTGGGNLSANRTIGLAATGTSGTYFSVKVDEYGRVVSGNTNSPDTNYYITGASVTTAASKVDVALSGNNSEAKASFTIPSATTTAAGVMTSADKTKLNGINSGATKVAFSQTNTSGDEIGKLTINDGTAISLYADNQLLTVKGGTATATTYNPATAKTLTVNGSNVTGGTATDSVSVTATTDDTITVYLNDVTCGDYA